MVERNIVPIPIRVRQNRIYMDATIFKASHKGLFKNDIFSTIRADTGGNFFFQIISTATGKTSVDFSHGEFSFLRIDYLCEKPLSHKKDTGL
ncbi:MAG TPA: hypothetical protein GXZ59_03020 [Clostridiaceae bacterium]|nr:hypothetical protein [Clostridiaceae bacterium]